MVLCFNNTEIGVTAEARLNFLPRQYQEKTSSIFHTDLYFFFLTQSLLQKLRLKNIFPLNFCETDISPGLSVISCMCKFVLPECVNLCFQVDDV